MCLPDAKTFSISTFPQDMNSTSLLLISHESYTSVCIGIIVSFNPSFRRKLRKSYMLLYPDSGIPMDEVVAILTNL